MGVGYSGADLMADLDIEYNYQGHTFDNANDLTNLLSLNLEFARDLDNYSTNVEHIMRQAEQYAKSFVRQNQTYNTGQLHDSIQAERHSSSSWTLRAPARDSRNHLYAGHIEYGFTDKAGQSHGPWPFLRPAIRLAAMDSRGELADAMAYNMLYGRALNGYMPQWKVAFGRSGNVFTNQKGAKTYNQMSKNYQERDNNGKVRQWGAARNGFNDYSGHYPKGTSSNQWTTGTNDNWDWGAL